MKLRTPTRAYEQKARAESTEATARRIIEAFLTRLMAQWFDEITLDHVAKDAGVTVQTVVRRFGGKEGLLGVAVETLGAQINSQRVGAPGDVAQLVESLLTDYEKTGDSVIRLLALEPRHPALKAVLDFGRGEHRRWATAAFGGLLNARDAAARQRALDALVVATDVYTWKLLRRDMGRSVRATAQTMQDLIQSTLEQLNSKPQ